MLSSWEYCRHRTGLRARHENEERRKLERLWCIWRKTKPKKPIKTEHNLEHIFRPAPYSSLSSNHIQFCQRCPVLCPPIRHPETHTPWSLCPGKNSEPSEQALCWSIIAPLFFPFYSISSVQLCCGVGGSETEIRDPPLTPQMDAAFPLPLNSSQITHYSFCL